MLTKTDQQNIETLVRTVVKDEVKHLPTKGHFDERMDKLTKEIQDARDELAAHAMSHERLNPLLRTPRKCLTYFC